MTQNITALWQMIQDQKRSDFLVLPTQRFSYRALSEHIEYACSFFDKANLTTGDRVTITLTDETRACALFLAAMLDGLVPVMLSPEASDERRAAIANKLEAKLVLGDTNAPQVPKGILKRSFSSARDRRPPKLPLLDEDALAYVLFTSGTTAEPRGVEISHKNLFSQLKTLIRLFDYSTSSKILNATPLSHTDGLVQGLLLAAVSGASLLRPGAFDVSRLEDWLDFLRSETATHMVTNPTLLTIVLRMAQEDDYFDRNRFTGIVSTGGVLATEIWDALEARFGVKVWNVYGMTETVADALYAGDHPEMGSRGTIGRPVDCQARVAGGTEMGELELSGDNITNGYWRNDALTSESMTSDGWFRTSDVVRARSDGSFDFLGRLKRTINQGAVKIHPEEIDEALASFPGCLEVATVGLPNADFEEIAVSAVVLSAPATEVDLFKHCDARLEPLRRPKRIVVLDELPKTPSGKTDLRRVGMLLEGQSSDGQVDTQDAAKVPSKVRVLEIAAKVFGASVDELDLNSSTDTVAGWDSFNHLNLMLEVEGQLKVTFATKEIISIRSLADLVAKVDEKTT